MASRVLLHLGDKTHKCFFSNARFQRTNIQSILKQTRNFKRVRKDALVRNEAETNNLPFNEIGIQQCESSKSARIIKGFVFATTFSGATFLGATIIEYERIRSKTYNTSKRFFSKPFKPKIAGWRADAQNWWSGLTEGQKTFYFICYANVLVFLAWKIPQFQKTMLKYFATNPASSNVCIPMLLSTFSHYNLWHLAANMYVLHSFSTAAVSYLGQEQFVALYLSAGVLSSFASNAFKILLNRGGFSIGASGAIMGVVAFICTQYPETHLNIIFLPQFTFTASVAIKSLMSFDALGCILGWKLFDHAAHLGGALFGIFWQGWGVENIWRKRAPVLTAWHGFREPPKSQ